MTDYKMDEKTEEKEMDKTEEKSGEEKDFDEKWRRDPLGVIVWAFILIWAGVVLLLNNMGLLDNWLVRGADTPGWFFLDEFGAWSFIFLGAGIIFLLEVLVRIAVPEYRKPVTGTLIFALILIGFGLGDIFSWDLFWPIILIILGGSIIIRGIMRGRR